MKLKVIWVVVLFVVLIGGGFTVATIADNIPKRDQIVCTCGCQDKAALCGCPVAIDILKKFDKKFKGA